MGASGFLNKSSSVGGNAECKREEYRIISVQKLEINRFFSIFLVDKKLHYLFEEGPSRIESMLLVTVKPPTEVQFFI